MTRAQLHLPGPVQTDALQSPPRHHRGRPRTVQHQSYLSWEYGGRSDIQTDTRGRSSIRAISPGTRGRQTYRQIHGDGPASELSRLETRGTVRHTDRYTRAVQHQSYLAWEHVGRSDIQTDTRGRSNTRAISPGNIPVWSDINQTNSGLFHVQCWDMS